MRIDVITIFPDMIANAVSYSVVKRAQEKHRLNIIIHDLRDHTHDQHRSVDDYCYGGGAGMLMKPEPLFETVESIKCLNEDTRVILLTPQGKVLDQSLARKLSLTEHMVLICGRYKGVDERVRQNLVTDEISVGDYVLSGGELPALILIDAVARLLPGVLGNYESAQEDSFSEGLLDCPHYTRPADYKDMKVPDVLLSGDPKKINKWQRQQAIIRTYLRRPDLLKNMPLNEEDLELIRTLKKGDI
ncbi:tRNA (guanosine(37)-N1)-methyltransferase TrmD [Candidatus Poribacteria bacterium]|nr:tRNA (guanosine(37)-N1)-methyltransferase TrmD [Candidatus Poribacteria bacterium]